MRNYFTYHPSPLGDLLISSDGHGIHGILFTDKDQVKNLTAEGGYILLYTGKLKSIKSKRDKLKKIDHTVYS